MEKSQNHNKDDASVKSRFHHYLEPAQKESEDDILQIMQDINMTKSVAPFALVKTKSFNTKSNIGLQYY